MLLGLISPLFCSDGIAVAVYTGNTDCEYELDVLLGWAEAFEVG